MTIVKVQYKRRFLGPPSLGKWDVYSAAWFSTSTTTLTTTQLDQLQRFFNGASSSGTSGQWFATTALDLNPNAAQISTWSFSGGALTHLADQAVTLPGFNVSPNTPLALPSQTAVAVGYRKTGMTPVQKGRSRFWIGPITVSAGAVISSSGGGLRLNATTVDTIHANVKAMRDALKAGGWTLQVKSGHTVGATFAAADELYVDDVFDVMRTRRAWQLYQKRAALT